MKIEKAILAGGCVWGVEELIRDLPGGTMRYRGIANKSIQQGFKIIGSEQGFL